MDPDDLPPLHRSQFSIDALTTAWKEVLADEAVCSLVSRVQVDSWQESLRQSSEDPSTYWANYLQSRPDGKDCADLIMKTMQDMLDCRTEVAASSESSRVLRCILSKFVFAYNAVPSYLIISDHLLNVNAGERTRHGGFSDVCSGALDDKSRVAIRRLRFPVNQNSSLIKNLCREAVTWQQLNHPHIVPFLGLATVDQFIPNSDLCMVSTWMSGGSLDARLQAQRDIQSCDKFRWIRQVCSGLRYLHEMHIIHGDLRGANILLDAKNDACIADFGLLQFIMDGLKNTTTETVSYWTVVAIRWMAPEVFLNEEFSYASDVYSFACTCLEIVTQTRPLPEIKQDHLFREYLREGNRLRWPTASTGNRVLDHVGPWIEAGFRRDPAERPTMEELYHSVIESPLTEDHLMEIVAATVLVSLPDVRHIKDTYSQCRCETVFDNWIRCCQSMEDGEQLADAFLCEMQQMLDQPDPGLEDDDLRLLRRTMLKFSIKSQVIPSVLFLHDVECDESEPRSGGSFGDIFYGKLGGQAVALKRHRLFQLADKDKYYKDLCKEALLWRQLRHPSVLAFLGLKGHISRGPVYMISPWMAHDSIPKYMQGNHTAVSPLLKRKWLFEVADGLSYLHDNGVIHGDLHGDNILLDEQDNAHLAGFSLARFADAEPSTLDESARHLGAARWTSPEVLRGGESTFASDVYSYASTCLEIVSGTRPFPDIRRDSQVMLLVHAGSLCPTWPHNDYPDLSDIGLLVESAWSVDPESRPRITELRDRMKGII